MKTRSWSFLTRHGGRKKCQNDCKTIQTNSIEYVSSGEKGNCWNLRPHLIWVGWVCRPVKFMVSHDRKFYWLTDWKSEKFGNQEPFDTRFKVTLCDIRSPLNLFTVFGWEKFRRNNKDYCCQASPAFHEFSFFNRLCIVFPYSYAHNYKSVGQIKLHEWN